MKQEERRERRIREIFSAAMEEFGTNGYENVTMDSLCARHGLSKGVLYHYFSNRDELFLLCVESVFRDLRAYLEQKSAIPAEQNVAKSIRDYFFCREDFFQARPLEKNIFENALLHPPKHLREQIRELRRPLQEVNRAFLRQAVPYLPLRPGLNAAEAIRYFESIESLFWELLAGYNADPAAHEAERLWDMVVFGVAQPEEGERGQREIPPAQDVDKVGRLTE